MSVVGKKIEGLTLTATGGKEVTFPESLVGKKTIIYFYPKDDTPGCTIQACSYRDNIEQFKDANIQVFGVSADDMASHDSFTEKFDLNFPLIVDSEKKLAAELEVSGRDSFLFDTDGVVVKEWKRVDPNVTVNETLEAGK